MSRRSVFLTITLLLITVLMLGGVATVPTLAAGPSKTPTSELPVLVDITGTIQSITSSQLTLTDGTVIKLTGQVKTSDLQVGQTVTISAELRGEDLVATAINAGTGDDTN